MERNIKDFIDPYGFICHKENGEWECGDSAQRTFTYAFFKYFLLETSIHFWRSYTRECFTLVWFLEKEPVRHPDPSHWWGQTKYFSRDQLIPVICALSIWGLHDEIQCVTKELLKRCGRLWNLKRIGQHDDNLKPWFEVDFCGPTTWGLIARYWAQFGSWWVRPISYLITYLCDLWTLMSCLFRVTLSHVFKQNVGDDLNFTLSLLDAALIKRTLLSRISLEMYMRLRGPAGEYKDSPFWGGNVVNAWRTYFWNQDDHPPMGELLMVVLLKMRAMGLGGPRLNPQPYRG